MDREQEDCLKEALKCCYNLFESLGHGKEEDGYYMQEFEHLGDWLELLGIDFARDTK